MKKVKHADALIDFEADILEMSKERMEYVEKSMAVANYISDFIKSSAFKQKDIALKLDKHESEISKWINGFHNLTLKSILKLESVSSIQLLNPSIFKIKPISAKDTYKVSSQNEYRGITSDEILQNLYSPSNEIQQAIFLSAAGGMSNNIQTLNQIHSLTV